MTGKELINIILDNNLENCEIVDGSLTFSDNDDQVIIHPIHFSNYSQWPELHPYFDYMEFNEKCNWFYDFISNFGNGNCKPFSTVERVPKKLIEVADEVFNV